MVTPQQIENALRLVRDQRSFVKELLAGALEWPIGDQVEGLGDISFDWSEAELRAEGLDKQLVAGQVSQVQPLRPDQPWGIFILEFKRSEVFTTGRGMTGPLRRVLRGLVPSCRRQSNLAAWKREHLLFICTHNYHHYRFAYFKAPVGEAKTSPLAAFGWSPDEPARTACELNLPELAWPDRGTKPADWIARWAGAFDVEKVTTRFYEDYAATFAKVEKLIKKQGDLDTAEDLRVFTQTLFNRLMFLRFIERKNWLELNGRHDYLRALFEAGPLPRQSLYKSRIRTLFFEGLAGEGPDRPPEIGKVPFLNGGLFEHSALDKKVKDIPDEAFAPIISRDGLFYRFNFTVEESTPLDIEVAVDPEMLGKVFEELVTGRHESGSYFTPRPVVSFMCREAIKGDLAARTKAPPAAIEALVDRHDVKSLTESHAKQILDALDSLKAVDPACGSGAYLLGLLQELLALYRLLYSEKLVKNARTLYDLKLRIISHNLYGVDIDPFATNIAMLRLWLSLAVEATEPLPLPNLDFKIETGDSLAGPCEVNASHLDFHGLKIEADTLVDQKDRFLRAHGAEKATLKQIIQNLEKSIKQKLRSLYADGVIDWRIAFADVLGKQGGFDIVLANPPYVRQELIAKAAKVSLLAHFTAVAEGKSDLYVYFYARGLELLRPGGMHVFICSNSWLDVGFGGKLQKHLLEHTHVRAIYDSAVERQFSTADINTVITVIRKGSTDDCAVTKFVCLTAPFEAAILLPENQRTCERTRRQLWEAGCRAGSGVRGYSMDKWGGKYLRAPASFQVLERSAKPMCRLGDELFWRFGRGRRTGWDDFFYLDEAASREWQIEARFLRPLIKSPTQFMDCPPVSSKMSRRFNVFLCHEAVTRLAGTNALRYIKHGQQSGANERNLASPGGRWYDLGSQPIADVILPIAFNDRFFVVLNDAGAEVHQRFAVLVLDDKHKHVAKPLAAILSSSLLPLMAEVFGRRGLGQGALDFPPEDWREVLIPHPEHLSPADIARLELAWDRVSKRVPGSVFATVDLPEFQALDEIVAELLGQRAEFFAQLRSDVVRLVESRLKKATSVSI